MSVLTRSQNMNLMRSVYKRLQEDAEAERDRASQDLYDRLQDLEFQKFVDELDHIVHNGSMSAKSRVEAIAELVGQLYDPDPENDYDDESDEVELGGVTPVDQRPST
jgi:hypothetical protein